MPETPDEADQGLGQADINEEEMRLLDKSTEEFVRQEQQRKAAPKLPLPTTPEEIEAFVKESDEWAEGLAMHRAGYMPFLPGVPVFKNGKCVGTEHKFKTEIAEHERRRLEKLLYTAAPPGS